MMSSGTNVTFSSRSRISRGLLSWIVSHGTKNVLLFLIMPSRFPFFGRAERGRWGGGGAPPGGGGGPTWGGGGGGIALGRAPGGRGPGSPARCPPLDEP